MMQKKQSSLSRILSYAGRHKNLTLLGCILSALSAVLGLIPYVCVWLAARNVLESWPALEGISGLARWGWTAVWTAIGSIALYFAALMSTHIAAFRTARNIRRTAMDHVLKLPLGFFTGNLSGRLRKLIDDNAGLTEDLLAHKLPDLAGTIVTPIAAIVMLFLFDWKMGLLCLLTMVLALLSMCMMMGGKNAGFFHRYQKEIERMSGEAVEYVRGIPVVKMFQQTVYSFKAFYAAIRDYSDLASQYAMSCRVGQTCFLTFINGAFALLIPAALLLSSSGDIRTVLVNFIFYALFAPACGQMINRIMYMSEAIMEADEAVGRLDEILGQKPMEESKMQKRPVNANISFDHVTFTYPGADRPALDNVSFSVRPGQVTALVGPSGGGKTTAASLIPRFWDTDSGTVAIGGVNVREMNTEDLMSQVAFVFQDTRLFKESLLENIRAARPEATRDEVLAAAHAAQCDDILQKLPQGLDTVVGTKGIYLSGGEQQRIALARAILKNAPIVVLDEATAFADPENEYQIQKAFEVLTKNKTVLMIAHRLSTVQNADSIIVLSDGKVVEQGSHESLLALCGVYTAMWEDYQRSARWKVGKEEAV
ncbi:ABC transporter ATP-binding protein [Mediterraneibacter glycyrrhizinilyticus]|uniref:ABC transporter ATP-binding protein n=2 Tax=Clostridia TaxID=186801 RepID=UPI000B391915|nr:MULTISPECIES: ABC transporter ATP-binding protein [Clostridia]MBM6852650.1 ABC transporter ATP-binding protein [Mediterraneibacter glycyrrhizinilyticus]OUO25566.1 ABC transporter ATP-binding protein [Eubacterium sp. An3]BDZ83334.1 ABC transporter ATP-binding protein [Claveliimonas bilis]